MEALCSINQEVALIAKTSNLSVHQVSLTRYRAVVGLSYNY